MAASSDNTARCIDHVVLPTASLESARGRLEALGFTVAPDAQHPFGTQNACVYFSDGTYLEPLAVAQRESCEAAARAGNVFVSRDLAFRFRRGADGFSALALKSEDAAGDRDGFLAGGNSAGENLRFSRPYRDASGKMADASFELAFAADLRSPDAFFFTVQRLTPLNIDRSQLEKHGNGTIGIRQVILSERNPSDFQYLLQDVLRQREVNAHSFGLELAAGNGEVSVLNAAGLKGFVGIDDDLGERGLRLRGVVFATDAFDRLPGRLDSNGIAFRTHGRRLVVPGAPGQGAVFIFEAA